MPPPDKNDKKTPEGELKCKITLNPVDCTWNVTYFREPIKVEADKFKRNVVVLKKNP